MVVNGDLHSALFFFYPVVCAVRRISSWEHVYSLDIQDCIIIGVIVIRVCDLSNNIINYYASAFRKINVQWI